MTKKKNKEKIKLLVWADSPAVSTGFATVSRNIFKPLAESGDYEIDIIGINDRGGWKDPEKHPYRIFPAKIGIDTGIGADFHGRPRLITSLLGKDDDLKPPWDIIFTLNDPFILEQPIPGFNEGTMKILEQTRDIFKKKLPSEYHYKIVSYWPVDSPLKGNWIVNSMAPPDRTVAYTEYGKEQILKANDFLDEPTDIKDKLSVINHGINIDDFHVLPKSEVKKFREDFFEGQVKDDTFLIVEVARNQMRKDLPRSLQVFAEFLKRRPDSFLYLHCKETDAWGSLREYARNWPILEFGKNWGCPATFSVNKGFPIEVVNMIYNVADCVLSTSLGEGWGFYNTEAMAAKTIVVGPNNTTTPELFGYDKNDDISDMDNLHSKVRGVPVMCETTQSEWATYGPTDFERIRPLTNVDDAVKKLIWVYDNPAKVGKMTVCAHKWVQGITWDKVVKKWDELFKDVYEELKKERDKADKAQKSKSKSKKSERVKSEILKKAKK